MSNSAVANIEIGATTNRLARGLTAARRAFSAFAVNAARGVSAAFSRIKLGETGSRALGAFGGDLMGRGMDAIVDGARSVHDFERGLIRFQIATDGTAQTTAALRAQIRGISKDSSVSADQVLAGASQYVALTGDAAGASTAMQAFADIAIASGASVEDVATATASLRTSMGLDSKDIEAAFSAMIIQGKEGAVEIKNLAGELASLAPQFAAFQGAQGLSGIRELGAAMQVVMKGAGTASQASTQLQSLMGALADTEVLRKLKKVGVAIYDQNGQLRNASDIFKELATNQKLGDERVVAEIFGRKESQMAIRSFREHIGLYGELRKSAEDTGAVQRDKATMLESDAGRIDAALNRVKLTIAEAFTPERITGFTNAIENAADKMEPLVGMIGKAGEILGGLTGVGQSIREFLDPSNPFEVEMRERRMMGQAGLFGKNADPAYLKAQRNAGAWTQATQSIMGAEKNGRVSPASLRQAYVLAKSNAGDSGESIAAQAYLNAAKANTGEIKAAWAKEIAESNRKGLQMIADAIRNMNLEVGRSEVVVATQKSAQHRRGVVND